MGFELPRNSLFAILLRSPWWVSILLALWLVIPTVGWFAMLYVFPLWLIAVSVLLATRSRSDSRPGP